MFRILLLSISLFQVTNQYQYTELDKLRIEIIKLKSQVLQLNQRIVQLQSTPMVEAFNNEVNKFVEEMRIKHRANKDDVFNWDTLKFEPPKKDK